jgi:hypothetical protein
MCINYNYFTVKFLIKIFVICQFFYVTTGILKKFDSDIIN